MSGGVEFSISAKIEQYLESLNKAVEATLGSVETMKGALESLSSAFEAVNGAMLAVTAVLAGGAAFKEAVEASQKLAIGAYDMGRQLGVSATQASVLKVAMDEASVPIDAVNTASGRISQTLSKNEQAFRNLGVATRDSDGNFRNSLDIMTDVNSKLASFKEGTDRNVEGIKIYGRAWKEIEPTIRLTGEAMEEARQKTAALGLVVGEQGVQQALQYRTAMAGVHTVFDALEKVVGDALVPVLTTLANWFNSVGPTAVAIMRTAVYTLYAAFSYLKEGVTIAVDYIKGRIDILGAEFQRLARAADVIKNGGNWAAVKQAWAEGTADITAKETAMYTKMVSDMKEAETARDAFFEKQDQVQTPIAEPTGQASTGDQKSSRLQEWTTLLNEKKALYEQDALAHGQILEFSKQQEIDYWEQILQKTRVSAEEKKQITSKIAADEAEIQKQRLQAALAELKNEDAAAGSSLTRRLEAEQRYAEQVKQTYGQESTEYAAAQRTILETKNKMVQQEREIDKLRVQAAQQADLEEIQQGEAVAKQRYEQGSISLQQLISLQEQYEARKYAIEVEGMSEQLTNLDRESVEYAKVQLQIEQLAKKHQQQMLTIANQEALQQQQIYKKVTDAMTNGFSQAFKGIITGSESVGKAFSQIFQSMVDVVIQVVGKIIAQWITQHVVAMALNKEQAASNAGVAATGAGQSAAQIPYIGWIIAIGAMASVFAAASSYKAEQGFDVPSGLSPVTQLHPREMVLPAAQADVVRNAAKDGGFGGGSSAPRRGGGDLHVHVHAIDARGVKKALMQGGTLEGAMRDLHGRFTR
jgi:hypothetical protein